MRNFLIGVTSTLIAGILLFLFQAKYEEWKSDNSQSISIGISDDMASFRESNLKKFTSSGASVVNISLLSIHNTGSDLIFEPKVYLSSRISADFTIFDSGTSVSIKESPPLKVNDLDQGAEITFPNLAPGEEMQFWIAHNCCHIFDVASKNRQLRITQFDLDDVGNARPSNSDSALWWLGKVVLVGVGLLLGAALAAAGVENALKARGIDLQASLKLPKNAVPEDGES